MVKLSRQHEEENRHQAILSHEGKDVIQLYRTKPYAASDHFTIFWRGYAFLENLHHFINSCYRTPNETLSATFFFEQTKQLLHPHSLSTVPSPLEQEVIEMYGSPQFVRYEIYPEYSQVNDLKQSRYSIWAGIDTPEQARSEEEPQNEIGLYTTFYDFTGNPVRSALLELVYKTIRPVIEPDVPRKFHRHFRDILIKAINK